jgi:hypothetical protein
MNSSNKSGSQEEAPATTSEPGADKDNEQQPQSRHEVGGPKGLEPTRYGDWEKGGRCIDF